MRSFPPSPSPASIENNTHHHLHEDFTLMVIVFVLYGIVAIRYATFNDGSRGTNLRFQRPQPPLPLPQPQPPMCPREIAAMIKDIVVDVELCCPICLEDLKKVDNDDDKVVVCLSKCNHSFHMNCIFSWLRESQDCPICRSTVYRGGVTLIK
ncbi:putative chromatin regulator PHD family [Arabidopsis thaliana]|uniref:RING-type E3 ubiquitin transferase n=3 Tax=Arabidopsis TaxID=3701 RepID=A0A178UU30_ARATH|nr:Zinc finger RING-type [Arabidopsis thaliana x Arabidopsis arenosa]KAG7608255.1 Zinc finger RING-type [Arabidopsis suecica]OAO96352.1 hypothetical protein AXX17_AT5G05410 [Arabidopsis thaliana]VYS66000.1 unnamed protein product [Arabidopsis thaliana]